MVKKCDIFCYFEKEYYLCRAKYVKQIFFNEYKTTKHDVKI